jgi:hypothetical protein
VAERACPRILVGALVLTAVAGASSALTGGRPLWLARPLWFPRLLWHARPLWLARLRVQIGGRRLTFLVSAGGDIQAG